MKVKPLHPFHAKPDDNDVAEYINIYLYIFFYTQLLYIVFK